MFGKLLKYDFRSRLEQTAENFDQRGFPAAVGAQQPHDAAPPQLQVHPGILQKIAPSGSS